MPAPAEGRTSSDASRRLVAIVSCSWQMTSPRSIEGLSGPLKFSALNLVSAESGEPERTLAQWIEDALERKPEIRKLAERIVRERAKRDGIAL